MATEWRDVFEKLWEELPSVEEHRILQWMKEVLEDEEDYSVYENMDAVATAAKKELNMVSRDDVPEIAAQEYHMIRDPSAEK